MDYYGKERENLPAKKETILDKLKRCETVGLMSIKGYTWSDIAEDQGISVREAKKLADEYADIIRQQALDDPEFMDRIQENTIRFFKEFEEIGKEAWETVRISTDAGMVGARINALKLASEIAAQKARLLQLLGGKVDSSYLARMQKAEAVNQILSSVIREIVGECDHCRDEAKIRLTEAFALMSAHEQALEAQSYEQPTMAEIVEDGDEEETEE